MIERVIGCIDRSRKACITVQGLDTGRDTAAAQSHVVSPPGDTDTDFIVLMSLGKRSFAFVGVV